MPEILSESIKKAIKKEYVKSKVKSLIAESVMLLIETKLKIIRQKFQELLNNNKITENEYRSVFKFDRSGVFKGPKGPFKHPIFAEMVYRTFINEENHTFSEIIDSFPMFQQKIIDVYSKKMLKNPRIPGTSDDFFPIVDLIESEDLTFSKYLEYLDLINRTDARSVVLQAVLDKGFRGDVKNFEIIYDKDDWIVVYPKTYLGSIATARMGPDKNYYTPPDTIGEMNWCTSIDSPGNMFLNYHRKLNMHMYYFTKKSGFNSQDVNRKVCISVKKVNNNTSLALGSASVNGKNKPFKTDEDCLAAVGKEMIDLVINDASKPSRLEISMKDYYESVSARQYSDLRKAAGSDEVHIEHFSQEIPNFLNYNKNPEIKKLILEDNNKLIVMSTSLAIQNGFFKPTRQEVNFLIVKTLLNENLEDLRVKSVVILRILQKCGELIENKVINAILESSVNRLHVSSMIFKYCKEIDSEIISKHLLEASAKDRDHLIYKFLDNKFTSNEHILQVLKLVTGYSRASLLKRRGDLSNEVLKIICSEPRKLPFGGYYDLIDHKGMTKDLLYIFWKSWYYRLDTFSGRGQKIPVSELDSVSSNKFIGAILTSKNVTSNIIDEILKDKIISSDSIYEFISQNKFVDPKYFKEALSSVSHVDKAQRVKMNIAENPSASQDLLRDLLNGISLSFKNFDIFLRLARNINSPKDVLKTLLELDHPSIKFTIASNPSAPQEFLIETIKGEGTAGSSQQGVLYAISNPSLPIEYLLHYIGNDGIYYEKAVRNILKRTGLTVKDRHDSFHELCDKLGYDYEKILNL